MGWFFGLKLHFVINHKGQVMALKITSGNTADSTVLEDITRHLTGKIYADKGYTMSLDTFTKALSRVEVNPGFPADLQPYMQQQAEILLADKKINAIPDWKTALRPDFMERARTAS